MRSCLLALGLFVALFAPSPARAQFANRSIGLSSGYMKLNEEAGLNWGVPVGLLYTTYIDSGFELTSHFHAMFLQDPVVNKTVIGITPQLGVRYLFLQESFRPYVAMDISYLHIFFASSNTTAVRDYVGLGPNLGADLFLSDSFSLGLRAQYNVYLMLNKPIQTSLGATLEVATYY